MTDQRKDAESQSDAEAEAPEYWGSTNGEQFQYGPYGDVEDAIECMTDECDEEPGTCLYIGIKEPIPFPGGAFGYWAVERMQEEMYDRVADLMDGWPGFTDEELAEFESVVAAAAQKKLEQMGKWPPRFFGIGKVVERSIPPRTEDVIA